MSIDGDPAPTRPVEERWWRRRPPNGVATSLAIGAAGMWVASALAPEIERPVDSLRYLISLPIALLLPAASLLGALVGWQAWQASVGGERLALALPALAALSANALAIALFARALSSLLLR